MSLDVGVASSSGDKVEGENIEATPARLGKHMAETDDEEEVDTKIEVGPLYSLKEQIEKDKVLFSSFSFLLIVCFYVQSLICVVDFL